MEIKILGTGCDKCDKLEANAIKAVEELGLDVKVIKVEDLVDIMMHGVMTTPALVIDGTVKSPGKVFSVDEIKKLISK